MKLLEKDVYVIQYREYEYGGEIKAKDVIGITLSFEEAQEALKIIAKDESYKDFILASSTTLLDRHGKVFKIEKLPYLLEFEGKERLIDISGKPFLRDLQED